MAKEFKDYDRKYSTYKGKYMPYEKEMGLITEIETLSSSLENWPYTFKQPGIQEARKMVYFADDSEEWQKFRVSLKGFSTAMKLARLVIRKEVFNSTKEEIRIDNYIGALKRGGQLDNDLNIIK